MISVETQQNILNLASQTTLSQRQIAKRVYASRGSVARVLDRGTVQVVRVGDAASSYGRRNPINVTPYVCEGCGFRVFLHPCMICRTQKCG